MSEKLSFSAFSVFRNRSRKWPNKLQLSWNLDETCISMSSIKFQKIFAKFWKLTNLWPKNYHLACFLCLEVVAFFQWIKWPKILQMNWNLDQTCNSIDFITFQKIFAKFSKLTNLCPKNYHLARFPCFEMPKMAK